MDLKFPAEREVMSDYPNTVQKEKLGLLSPFILKLHRER